MPRRVLHILGNAQYEATGMARIVATLSRGLDPQKYSISAFFLGTTGPLMETLRGQGISTRVIPWRHPYRDPLGLFRLWWELRKEHFDIVHVHWGGRGVRWVAARALDAKLVFHLHGRVNESKGLEQVRIATNNADVVIAVSESVAAASGHEKTRVVYSGVETVDLTDIDRRKLGMTIGSAGRLLPLKGLNYLLRAVALLRTEFPLLRLEIAGEGPELDNLRRLANELALDACVGFLGWVSDTRSRMADWSIFVQPSLEEGLPVAVLEAMAAGVPVVASAVGGLPEMVEEGRTGRLVPPANTAALADCLRQMLRDPDGTRKMGESATIRVREQFSSQRMVQQVSEIYDELLEGDRAS